METFCTIITRSYLPLAKALHKSLENFITGIQLHVVVVDDTINENIEGVKFIDISVLANLPLFQEIEKKYRHKSIDTFRWAIKPLLITHLLQIGFDKVIYCDSDIYFVNDYSFLLKKLNSSNIILTPHWRNMTPDQDEENFIALFKDGLFNAGFIGASIKGLQAIQWWAHLCHYRMDKNAEFGIYEDQRYLDAMIIKFPETEIIRHRGCNVAYWNKNESQRTNINGDVFINTSDPIIFIHFNSQTIVEIDKGNDPELKIYLEQYRNIVQGFNGVIPLTPTSTAMKLKSKLRIRTRVKAFIYKIAESL